MTLLLQNLLRHPLTHTFIFLHFAQHPAHPLVPHLIKITILDFLSLHRLDHSLILQYQFASNQIDECIPFDCFDFQSLVGFELFQKYSVLIQDVGLFIKFREEGINVLQDRLLDFRFVSLRFNQLQIQLSELLHRSSIFLVIT